jgi:hypothetical protein
MSRKFILKALIYLIIANGLVTLIFWSYDFNAELYMEYQNNPIWMLYALANIGGLIVTIFNHSLNTTSGMISDLFS